MRALAKTAGLVLILLAPLLQAAHVKEPHVDIDEVSVGTGLEAVRYSIVEVHYTGRLDNGDVFDSSRERGQPFRFTLGAGQVIPGWEMGILGMKSGGERKLTIPPELAYGSRGAGNVIPPNAKLSFEVELVAVTPPPFASIDSAVLAQKLESGVKLIDIRRPEEWRQTGVVAGSIKATAFDANGKFQPAFIEVLESTVQPDEEFIVICRTGNRTAALSNWLSTRGGYPKVLNVSDGIVRWMEEGRAVDKSGG